jgi:hypothetical protein
MVDNAYIAIQGKLSWSTIAQQTFAVYEKV